MKFSSKRIVSLLIGLSMSLSFADEVPSYIKEFENLPEEKRLEYVKYLREAQRLFGQQRIFEALDQVNIAETIIAEYPSALSVKGACLVEFRDFDAAQKVFKRALSFAPDNNSVLFNIGEIHFVKGEWEESKKFFKRAMQLTESDPTTLTHKLAEFKTYICDKKLKNNQAAQEIEGKYDYRSDTPSFYYINAVKAFEEGSSETGNLWMTKGRRVFKPAQVEAWHDSLVESGYLKSFYGGGDRAIDISSGGGEVTGASVASDSAKAVGGISQDVEAAEISLPSSSE